MKENNQPRSLNKEEYNTKRYHIVLLNLWRVINAKGGTEKVFIQMAKALDKLGFEVSAIFYDENCNESYPIPENINFINAFQPKTIFNNQFFTNIRAIHPNRRIRHYKRKLLISKQKCNNLLKAFHNWNEVDLIIAFQPEAAYFVKDLMKLDVPLVTMYHLTPEAFDKKSEFDEQYQNSVNKGTAVQVLMPEYIPIAKRLHPHIPIVCIPNVAPQYDSPSSLTSKTIINVARLSKQKRPELLIEAFSLLKDRYPDWNCEWWGEYHVEPELTYRIQCLIEKYDLKGRFLLKGTTNDIDSKLRTSSIFAFPSSYEGQSLALLEAMSMGLSVIGCIDCPSVNSMIKNGENGLLTQPTAEAYAEGLAKLMEDQNLRSQFGTKAREYVAAYSPESVWKQWSDFIYSIIT